MNNYVVYHLHSDYSILDSTTKSEDYISKAKELNMQGIGFSEHGNIYNWIKKKQMCDKAKIKYMHGSEFYLTESLDERIRDNYHTILYAKNYEGVKELNSLISLSNKKDHFYYKPRLSFSEFLNISENIISISACLASPLNKLKDSTKELEKELLNNCKKFFKDNYITSFSLEDDNESMTLIKKIKEKRKNYYLLCQKYDYYEIQPHHKSEAQIKYNKYLYRLSNKHNKKLIMGTDTHELNAYKQKCRSILKKAKNMGYDNEDEFNLTFRSYDELINECILQNCFDISVYKEAIDNTNLLCDTIENFELDKSFKYPRLYDNEEFEYIKVVKEKLEYKIKNKIIDTNQINLYKKLLNEEFVAFKKQGMFSYMLFVSELNTWCWKNNIPTGYGRGSCTGSLSAYILDITDVNPIKWGTIFSRFVNADRISLADIDIDYSPNDRNNVYDYIRNRFGENKTSYIVTFNSISEKGTISEITRALNYNFQDSMNIKKKFEENEELCRAEYPDVFYYYDGLIDTYVSVGIHPCGFIACLNTLNDNIGFYYNEEENPISQCDMKAVDSLNYVKFDILGLKNIGIIKETYKILGVDYKKSHEINWNDKLVWDDMIKSPAGIFQFESGYSYSLLKQFKPQQIDDMSLINASLRPSGESYRDKILKREFHHNPTKEIDELLKNNYGFLVYQEDSIKFLQEICGMSGAEADTVRRCVDENTLILNAHGYGVKIKDLKAGDQVQSYNEKYGCYEAKKVVDVFNNGTKNTYRIKTIHDYEIIATENHKVFTQRGWVEVGNLNNRDYLMTPNKINCISDNLKSSNRLSQTDMFMLGLLIGDGCMGEGNSIHFTNSEIELINKYKDCISNRLRNGGICEFLTNYQKGVTVDKIYSVYIKSDNYKKSLKRLLEKLDLLHNSQNKRVPLEIRKYPIGNKLSNFIAGLFNTDGYIINQNKCIEYATKSSNLAIDIKNILLKYGVYSYIYKKYISGYDYYMSVVRISQEISLSLFDVYFTKFMIGNKKLEFINAINSNKCNRFNYLLSDECRQEIIESSKKSNKSIRSSCEEKLEIHQNEYGISDIKARKFINTLCCPLTYKILMSNSIPVRIKTVEKYGTSNVFDIEVEDNHNYVANGLLVHNCIGKKDEEGLKQMLPKVKQGYINNSNKNVEVAEKEVEEFMQILSDSSDYQFGFNHSTSYSMIGYTCAYLRYYFPLEFITAFLNMAQNEEDLSMGQELAKLKNIKIMPITFGISHSDYAIDENKIYKGMRSIKYINDKIPKELNTLYSKNLSFPKLLFEIKENTSVNSRQLDVLIKVGYFNQYAKIGKLLEFLSVFNSLSNKTYKKSKISELMELYISRYSDVSINKKTNEITYKSLDKISILTDIWNDLEDNDVSDIDKIKYQMEYIGYLDEIPNGLSIAKVEMVSVKYRSCNLKSLRDNSTRWFKFNKNEVGLPSKGDVIIILESYKKEGWKERVDYYIKRYEKI